MRNEKCYHILNFSFLISHFSFLFLKNASIPISLQGLGQRYSRINLEKEKIKNRKSVYIYIVFVAFVMIQM